MGLFDTPRGVVPRTGMLLSTVNSGAIANGEVGGALHRIDLGPGFAVGIHGAYCNPRSTPDADAESYRYFLSLDPNVDLTSQPAVTDGSIAYEGGLGFNVVTSGAFSGHVDLWVQFSAPILTVQNFASIFVNDLGTSLTPAMRVHYAIYEVSDADFLRIAGVSLARS